MCKKTNAFYVFDKAIKEGQLQEMREWKKQMERICCF